jgi:hypothetical protein
MKVRNWWSPKNGFSFVVNMEFVEQKSPRLNPQIWQE